MKKHKSVIKKSHFLSSVGENFFTLDLRSLALCRIFIGLLMLADLFVRAHDLVAHYTNEGIMPIPLLTASFINPWDFSFHTLSGGESWIRLLFFIHSLLLVALIVGYRTRWMTLLTWIFLISLHNRNPLLQHGGDVFLRIQLFWAIFIPWGEKWSFDRYFTKKPVYKYNHVMGIGTIGFLLQFFLMYEFTGILKLMSEDWQKGIAVIYALNLDCYASNAGALLQSYPKILKTITYCTLAFEVLGPLLLITSLRYPLVRLFGVLSFIGLHFGFWIFMEIGFFPWFCIALLIGILPPYFWEQLLSFLLKGWNKMSFAWRKKGLVQISPSIPFSNLQTVQKITTSTVMTLFLGSILLYATLSNIESLTPNTKWMPASINRFFGNTLKMNQKWRMFVRPPSTERWLKILATGENGVVVELFSNEEQPDLEKKNFKEGIYWSHRWRKLLKELETDKRSPLLPHLANTLATLWEDNHPESEKIKKIQILEYQKKTFTDASKSLDEMKIIYELEY